jgi:hypothetical protein
VLLGALALWNAASYPVGAGYDAPSHMEYADFLVDHHRIPHRNETPEYYSPPGYYTVAGVVTWIGRKAGMGEPHKLGQLLNVPIMVAAGIVLLRLARLLWPRRRWLPVAALAFFVACPVVLRVASMFQPEPLDLLLSVLALYLAARMLVEQRFSWRDAGLLGLVLGAGELVRQFSLWTFAVVIAAFLLAAASSRELRRPTMAALAMAVAVTALIAGPWYVYRSLEYGNAVFDRPHPSTPLWDRRPASFYIGTGWPEVLTHSYRPNFKNRVWPQTYSDIWGDWYGVFAWPARERVAPSTPTRTWLGVQQLLGLLPTLLAIGGWLTLLVLSLVRRDAPRLLPSLLPLAGLVGFFYFTVSYPTRDGDVIKPLYLLTTAPAWALCFAWAVDRLGSRSRGRAVVIVLACVGVLVLPFLPYRGALGR